MWFLLLLICVLVFCMCWPQIQQEAKVRGDIQKGLRAIERMPQAGCPHCGRGKGETHVRAR